LGKKARIKLRTSVSCNGESEIDMNVTQLS
jgi:hypothetical protein